MSSAYTSTLKLIKESLPLITALGMIVGSSVIALYAVRIGFFPSGITAGDTIVLLSIFVAVVICCALLTFVLYTQIVLASQLVRPAFNYFAKKLTSSHSVFIPGKAGLEELQVAFIGAMLAAWIFFGVLLSNRQLLASEGMYDLLMIIFGFSILYVAVRSRKANVADPQLLNNNIKFAEIGMWLMIWLLPAAAIIFSTQAHDLLLSFLKIRL